MILWIEFSLVTYLSSEVSRVQKRIDTEKLDFKNKNTLSIRLKNLKTAEFLDDYRIAFTTILPILE